MGMEFAIFGALNEKDEMKMEVVSTLVILVMVSLMLMVVDAAVSGVVAWCTAVTFKRAFCWGLLSLLIPVALMGYGILIERNRADVTKVEMKFPNLPESFKGYRIVQLSDIHSRSFEGREDVLRKMVDQVNALQPDLIVFTGDVITMDPDELDSTQPVLSQLKAKDGVVSVLGNHDYGVYMDPRKLKKVASDDKDWCPKEVARREREMGWRILLDENVVIRRGVDSIAVVGVENTTPSPHFESRGDLARASQGTEGMFRVLLSHDPMHWDMEVRGKDYPLMLSGHTHAVQFSLFGFCPSRFMFKQYRGLYESGDQKLYVNIGLGETIFPARIGAAPEITLITLN